MQGWVRYGGITGAIIASIWVGIALLAPQHLFNAWTGWFPMVVTVIGMVIYDRSMVVKLPKDDFQTSTSGGVHFYLVSRGRYSLVDFSLYQGIIDQLGQLRLDISLERIKANEDVLGKDNARVMAQNLIIEGTSYTFSSFLFNFARSLLGGFFLAAIIGRLIMRNQKQ
jgi:hypothetical protein